MQFQEIIGTSTKIGVHKGFVFHWISIVLDTFLFFGIGLFSSRRNRFQKVRISAQWSAPGQLVIAHLWLKMGQAIHFPFALFPSSSLISSPPKKRAESTVQTIFTNLCSRKNWLREVSNEKPLYIFLQKARCHGTRFGPAFRRGSLLPFSGFAQIFGCKIKDFFQTFSKMLISFSSAKFSIYSLSHDALWTYSNHDAVLA